MMVLSDRGPDYAFVPYISIKAIPMNRGREKAVWVVIFTFSGIFTHKSGISGKIVSDNNHPQPENKPRWI
jgi:hypothetical protein